MAEQHIIAIDGPAASGKGTLAKKIAAHFNLPILIRVRCIAPSRLASCRPVRRRKMRRQPCARPRNWICAGSARPKLRLACADRKPAARRQLWQPCRPCGRRFCRRSAISPPTRPTGRPVRCWTGAILPQWSVPMRATSCLLQRGLKFAPSDAGKNCRATASA